MGLSLAAMMWASYLGYFVAGAVVGALLLWFVAQWFVNSRLPRDPWRRN